eukprot:scpid108460/ scgid7665/ 
MSLAFIEQDCSWNGSTADLLANEPRIKLSLNGAVAEDNPVFHCPVLQCTSLQSKALCSNQHSSSRVKSREKYACATNCDPYARLRRTKHTCKPTMLKMQLPPIQKLKLNY